MYNDARVKSSCRCAFADEKSGWVSKRSACSAVTCTLSPPSFVQGQYIKSVFEGGPAELAGMLCGDHVLEVDGTDVTAMSHMKVCPHAFPTYNQLLQCESI